MRRFEFSEGSSNKFWEIEVEGTGFTVRYGRIGAAGQTQTKTFATAEKAQAEADKLIKEKTGKGYAEVESSGKLAAVAPKVAAAAKVEPATAPAPAPAAAPASAAGAIRWTEDLEATLLPRRGGKRAPAADAAMTKKALLEQVALCEKEMPSYDANAAAARWQTLRAALAAAGEADYQAALALARQLWAKVTALMPRSALGYAFPEEPAWSAQATTEFLALFKKEKKFAQHDAAVALLGALSDPALQLQLAKVCASKRVAIYALTEQVPSMIELCGAAAAESIGALLETGPSNDHKKGYAAALTAIESPVAARALADALGSKVVVPIATEYFKRVPALAAPALQAVAKTSGSAAPIAAQLLRELAPASPAPAASASAPAAAKAAAVAGNDALPKVLASPPWLSQAPRKAPPVVALSTLDRPTTLHWEKGEREKQKGYHSDSAKKDIQALLTDMKKLSAEHGDKAWCYIDSYWSAARLDDDALLEAWKSVRPDVWRSNTALVLLSRLGEKVLPEYIDYAASLRQPNTTRALINVVGPSVAPLMAKGFADKRVRAEAETWLLAHPEMAAVGIIPMALSRPAKDREIAAAALRMLVEKGQGDAIRSVAKEYGSEAEKALGEVLAADPASLVPDRLPKLPAFFDPATLPPLLLNDRKRAVPAQAVGHLGTMLAFSTLEAPYAGLAQVKAACDPDSLDEWAWALFGAWNAAGAPSKENWAFVAMGLLGGDGCARRITPLLRAWPGEGLHQRAVLGLEVLALIGTDLALTNLHGISQKVKFKGLQEKAQEKIAQIAEARGLSVDELADRLVPDLDLDPDGSKVLDFGPRQFRVGFDEALKPFVKDASGSRLPDLPKPGKSDDAARARQAVEAFKLLKKDARAIASGQIIRLELAMIAQRRWDVPTFRTFLLEHPLMKHLVKLLLWGAYDAKGKLKSTFRVAEDGSFADLQDTPFELAGDALVGLPHLLALDPKVVEGWGKVFADYQLLQPFAQLSRQVFRPEKDELKSKSLERLSGLKTPTGRLMSLLSRGWRKGPPQDAGGIYEWQRALPGHEEPAFVTLEPGIWAGGAMENPEQTLGVLCLPVPAGELDPIAFSELVADLSALKD